jgi:hypothetical protein
METTAIEDTIKNLKVKINYSDIYEKCIYDIQNNVIRADDLLSELKSKREFGLNKYKEKSFQFSLENTIASPTLKHAGEEIVDAINYISGEIYKNRILGGDEEKALEAILNQLISILIDIRLLMVKVNKGI